MLSNLQGHKNTSKLVHPDRWAYAVARENGIHFEGFQQLSFLLIDISY